VTHFVSLLFVQLLSFPVQYFTYPDKQVVGITVAPTRYTSLIRPVCRMGHGSTGRHSPWHVAGHPGAAPGTWPCPFAGQWSSWRPLRRCGTCPTARRLFGSGFAVAADYRWYRSRRLPPPGPPTRSARQSGHRSSRSEVWPHPSAHRSVLRGCVDRQRVPATGLISGLRWISRKYIVWYMVFRPRREIRARFEVNVNCGHDKLAT